MLQIQIISSISRKKLLTKTIFFQITIPPGAYEIDNLSIKIEKIIIDKGHYTEDEYPFMIKPNFSMLGCIIEIQTQGPIIGFVYDESIRNLLGFNETILYEENNLSKNPVDISFFDYIFLKCDIAQGRIFKGSISRLIHNLTLDVNPEYKYIKKFRVGVQRYMMESNDNISSICFKLKIVNNQLVSFNGQTITFRLSIK